MRQTIETPEQLLDAIAEEVRREARDGMYQAWNERDPFPISSLFYTSTDLELEVEVLTDLRGTVYVSGTLTAKYEFYYEGDGCWEPSGYTGTLWGYEDLQDLEVWANDPLLLDDWGITTDRVAERIMRD